MSGTSDDGAMAGTTATTSTSTSRPSTAAPLTSGVGDDDDDDEDLVMIWDGIKGQWEGVGECGDDRPEAETAEPLSGPENGAAMTSAAVTSVSSGGVGWESPEQSILDEIAVLEARDQAAPEKHDDEQLDATFTVQRTQGGHLILTAALVDPFQDIRGTFIDTEAQREFQFIYEKAKWNPMRRHVVLSFTNHTDHQLQFTVKLSSTQ
ncbi:hypothetical protein Pelo_19244 [Pelomyxa schiedti]|nr:hypothetical protein Pelo_19244 [Pelomyxa schiedti]